MLIMMGRLNLVEAAPVWRLLWLFLFTVSCAATANVVDANITTLQVIQLAPPVLATQPACEELLVSYSFANSYGKPFVGAYQPPPCAFNRVTLALNVSAIAGRQFDRLALVFLGDVEIFRTSTAEPSASKGIVWSYTKDVSHLLWLFTKPQPIIFDLGNIVDNIYTSPFNVVLTARFSQDADVPRAADLIFPVSAKRSAVNASSAFNYPEQPAMAVLTLPRNMQRAVYSVSAVGQIDEEFWWSNVPSSTVTTYPGDPLLGLSPFREVQLYIDDALVGVAWPFQIIFTGGIVPSLWRPLVGIDTFDLREDEVDITPWLPLLSDGKPHTFSIRVAGLSDDGRGNASVAYVQEPGYWVVTGKVFIWLDQTADSITTGMAPIVKAPEPSINIHSTVSTRRLANNTLVNDTLAYEVAVQRFISVSTTVATSDGPSEVTWEQTLAFTCAGNLTANGTVQYVDHSISGSAVSSNGYSRVFQYPLNVFSAYQTGADQSLRIEARLDRKKNDIVHGQLSSPSPLQGYHSSAPYSGSVLSTRQNGTAQYYTGNNFTRGYSFGSTEQDLSLSGVHGSPTLSEQVAPVSAGLDSTALLYHRHVLAVNDSIVYDSAIHTDTLYRAIRPFTEAEQNLFAIKSVRRMLGRG